MQHRGREFARSVRARCYASFDTRRSSRARRVGAHSHLEYRNGRVARCPRERDSPMEVRCRSLRPSRSFCCASCRRRATPRCYGSLEGPRDDTDVERPSICDILPSEPSKKLEPDATITRSLCKMRPRRCVQKPDAQKPGAQKPVGPESSCDGEDRNREGRRTGTTATCSSVSRSATWRDPWDSRRRRRPADSRASRRNGAPGKSGWRR
jgi:hypothetical protein